MAKKIFDILPPKPPTTFREEKKPPIIEKVTLPKRVKEKVVWVSPKISLKKSLILVILILIMAGFLLSFKFSKAEIKIWPETDMVNFKTKLSVEKGIGIPDFKNKVIPGEIFEIEKTISQEFPSSGKLLKKAEGTIRLYNEFTTNTENWLSGTRFVSSDGKLFLSKNKIAVPGAEVKNGKMVPSSVDVPVIAAEPGSDYNIGPSHFSIVVFRGTPRYTKFYGESLQPMIGGGESYRVTKEDLEQAENTLTNKAKTESKETLKSKISSEFLFLGDAVETKILDKFSSATVGTEIEKFNYQVKVKSTTISLKKENIEKFAEQFISLQIPEGKLLYKESLKIDYTPEVINLESGKLSLSLNLSAKIYPEIDEILFKKGLVGKPLSETKIFLENQPRILKSEIRISPFWVKTIPQNIEKIKVKYPLID